MSRPGLALRSAFFWVLSIVHFFPVCTLLVLLGVFVDPRRNDRALRLFSRNVLRLAGVRLRVVRSPGFDSDRTSFFVCNHVNLFDPFVIYSAIPQFVRGLELESHFRVPVYGWMMKRFGNVPVPVERTADSIRAMKRRCREALSDGVSLIVFPEGTRTRTGKVGHFHSGVFRMAKEFGTPLVPMSIVGSFRFKRVGSWMLRPSTIVVHLHDTIELDPDEPLAALKDRVRRIVREPIEPSSGNA